MTLVDNNDPVRALGFIVLNSAYAEMYIDEFLEKLQITSLQNAQVSQKLRHLKKATDDLEWVNDEGKRFAQLLDEAANVFDKRGQYIHNRYIDVDGEILMKPARPDRPEEIVTSGTLYAFADKVADMASAFLGSEFDLHRAICNSAQSETK